MIFVQRKAHRFSGVLNPPCGYSHRADFLTTSGALLSYSLTIV